MTPIVIIILVYVFLFGLPIFMLVFMFYWLWKNNINISVVENREGVNLYKSGRYRMTKHGLYPIRCFWAQPGKEFPIDILIFNEYVMVSEGLPLIGTKQTLKLKYDSIDTLYTPWLPPVNLPNEGLVSNIRIVKIAALRQELWESTKSPLTRQELMMKLILPAGLIMLAIVMIIFFPKIYQALQGSNISNYEAAKDSIFNWLGQSKPPG